MSPRFPNDLGPHPDFPNSRVIHDPNMGFYRTEPYPTEEELSSFYTQEYRNIRQESPTSDYVAFMKFRAVEQSRFILEHSKRTTFESVADVGCGCGELLGVLEKHASACTGFETDQIMAKYAIDHHSSKKTTIRNEHFTTGTAELNVDLFIMSHVFEHIPHPRDFLADLRKSTLVPGGILFLEVPNDPAFWVKDQIDRNHRGLGHLNYFTLESLGSTVGRAGYQILEIRTCGMTLQKQVALVHPGKVRRLMKKITSRCLPQATVLPDYSPRARDEEGSYLQVLAIAD
jgi:2-polyprenyl-3-methyl-5-hydroxy-6-metoxy-1,4-benzoquinol methylase